MCECSLRNCGCHSQPSCHQSHHPPSNCNCHQPSNCQQQNTCRCQEQTVETVVPIKVEITPDISFCVEQADVKTEHKSSRRHSRKCDCYECYRKSKRR